LKTRKWKRNGNCLGDRRKLGRKQRRKQEARRKEEEEEEEKTHQTTFLPSDWKHFEDKELRQSYLTQLFRTISTFRHQWNDASQVRNPFLFSSWRLL